MRPVGGHSEDGLTPCSSLSVSGVEALDEDEDDAQMQHEPEVIRVEDRAEGLVLSDL
jgi:hypothetical protein